MLRVWRLSRARLALGEVQRARFKLMIEEATRIDRAGQHNLTGRDALKPHARIIGLVADQENQLPPRRLGFAQTAIDERLSDPLTPEHWLHDQRPEEQSGLVADVDRGHRDGAHHQRAHTRDKTEAWIGIRLLPDPVGGPRVSARPEHSIIQAKDWLGVVGSLGFEHQRQVVHAARPIMETERRQAPAAFGSRQARSNGSRQALGAMSWWIDCGPQEPCS